MTYPDDDLPDPRTAELLRGARREITPTRDLWPGIEGRLRRRGAGTQRHRWYLGLAAAAGVILALWTFRPGGVVRHEVASEDEVTVWLAQTTGPHAATAKSLARHLEIVAQAITETRTALAETPGDPALQEFLQNLERRRLALLAQAARYAAAES